MTRIVAIADTHMEHPNLTVPDGDIFVHAGDLLDDGTLDELRTVRNWIAALPHRHKIVIAGNHDRTFEREPAAARALLARSGITYLQDSAVGICGLYWYGAPWQPECGDWAFGMKRGPAIAAMWALIPSGLDVLITHGPPCGYGDTIYNRHVGTVHVGCDDLLRRVESCKPRVHLFGHIHSGSGTWRGETLFANVTTAEGRLPPTVIDIDGSVACVISPKRSPSHEPAK